jgi:hypothetical protein
MLDWVGGCGSGIEWYYAFCIRYPTEIILALPELISAPSSLASEHVLRLILQVDATGLSINDKTPKEWLIQPSLPPSINLPPTQLTHPPSHRCISLLFFFFFLITTTLTLTIIHLSPIHNISQ